MGIVTAPVSDMQRRGAALVRQARETKEPIYLTRHGVAEVALVDADEFNAYLAYQHERAEYLRRRHEGINRGHQQMLEGKYVSWDVLKAELRELWGDDVFGDAE